MVANFIGFSFAFLLSPQVMAGNPYTHHSSENFPVFPVYWDYLVKCSQGDFGTTYGGERVLDVAWRVGLNSLGLMGIALVISITGGIGLGRLAVRQNKRAIATWLTFKSDSCKSFLDSRSRR